MCGYLFIIILKLSRAFTASSNSVIEFPNDDDIEDGDIDTVGKLKMMFIIPQVDKLIRADQA